jgi:hypothetical protein
MFAGQGAGYLLRAAYLVLIARLLGVLQYGVIVGAIALVNNSGNILLVTASMSSLLIFALHLVAGHLIAPASAAVIVPAAIASRLCEQLTIGAGQVSQTFGQMHVTATPNLLTYLAPTLAAGGMLLVLHHHSRRVGGCIGGSLSIGRHGCGHYGDAPIWVATDHSTAISKEWSRRRRVCTFSGRRYRLQRSR